MEKTLILSQSPLGIWWKILYDVIREYNVLYIEMKCALTVFEIYEFEYVLNYKGRYLPRKEDIENEQKTSCINGT